MISDYPLPSIANFRYSHKSNVVLSFNVYPTLRYETVIYFMVYACVVCVKMERVQWQKETQLYSQQSMVLTPNNGNLTKKTMKKGSLEDFSYK